MASDLKRKREDEPDDEESEAKLDAEIAKVLQVSRTNLWILTDDVQKHKLPTGEELRTLKDAADLYQSSSFKLQVRTVDFLRMSLLSEYQPRLTPCSPT
jgi:U3 small nucleolar RNA-associated protein 22